MPFGSKGVAHQSHYRDKILYNCSLLEKNLISIVAISLSTYILLQSGLYGSKYLDFLPNCERATNLPNWLRTLNFGSSFAFLSNSILQFCFAARFVLGREPYEKPLFAMHVGILTVLLIAGLSQFQTYYIDDFICVDGFG